ncbi:guanylate kinase [Candidatus Pantoea edessiphila]|uniref:Guanylate kinase n=1 Tax=Candidatus Pantoea edessiphila TaxID=2044610 RepID=A0A2P5SXJ0_9GAMM|nr:guanylate kinase [Candidatus Pantoea edessiphila]MBK4775713.1 guanylate kinase [Pantoea sp. Edef]PPI87058.1 guanylate kinase [Candidatus Pantoea edessiphila]
MFQSILHIVSAPSGTGKSSLIQALLEIKKMHSIRVSISYTTRSIRPGELHGKHYYFISKSEFETMIANHDFLEYAQVFKHYYGTSLTEVNNIISRGFDVLLDIDWQGAQQIRNKISNTKSIFILPPSKNELNKRLLSRGQDNKEVITLRMKKSIEEMRHYKEYDYLIINDDFNVALSELKSIICAERLNILRQTIRYKNLINNLLAIY